MTTDQQPPEESPYPVMLPPNQIFSALRPKRLPDRNEPAQPLHPSHQALLDLMAMPMETRYIALDVSASTFGMPSADRDSAIESLYEKMGYDGSDTYTSTVVIIEAAGNPILVRSLASLFYTAGYMRLQSYRPNLAANRRDALAADIDESERLH